MKRPKRLVVVPLVVSMLVAVAPSAGADPKPSAAPSASSVRSEIVVDRRARVSLELTSGLALPSRRNVGGVEPCVVAREERSVELPEGTSDVVWDDVPESLHAETLDLRVPDGITVESERVVDRVPGPAGIEAFLHGKSVDARPYEGSDGEPTRRERPVKPRWSGAVVALDGGLVLRTGASYSVLPASEVTLHEPKAARAPRRIEVRLRAKKAGRVALAVTAVVEKIVVHEPRYVLAVDAASHTLHLHGAVSVTNGSGMAIEGGGLHLGVAGYSSIVPRRESPFDLAATFVVGNGSANVAFDLTERLRFSSVGVAEPTLVDAATVPYREQFVASFGGLEAIRQKSDGARLLEASHVYAMPAATAPPGSAKLPAGAGWVLDGTSGRPASALARGTFFVGKSGELAVHAREYGVGVLSRALAGTTTECNATTKWEHSVPASLLARGPVRLELPFDKRDLQVNVTKTEGVTLEVLPDGSRAIVFAALAPSATSRSHDPPRKVNVTYKTNHCVK